MPQTKSKSRKVTMAELSKQFNLVKQLKKEKSTIEHSLAEAVRVFDNMSKKASAETCKEFLSTGDIY